MGEMDVYVVDVKVLVQKIGTSVAGKGLAAVKEKLLTANEDDIRTWVPGAMTYVKCTKQSLLYVPTGMLVIERVVQGPLIFGCRRSFFLRGLPLDSERYDGMKDLLSKDGRDCTVMDTIAALLPSP